MEICSLKNREKRIIFIGSVEIGLTILEAIYKVTHVHSIFTLPLDKASKTSGFVDFEPVAKKYNSVLMRTDNINSPENISIIKKISPDLIITAGWQRLISKEILDIPLLGTVGFHSSLLPKFRGRAPVNWAIILGEKETGITMFYLTPEADNGDIIAQESFEILLNDDCNTVYKKSAQAGAYLISKYLDLILEGKAPRIHNPATSYPAYPKRTPQDGEIDFNRSSIEIYNFVRALTKPYPGAYYFNSQGEKILVWKLGILFDESRIQPDDIVIATKDLPVYLIDWEISTNSE